LFKRKNYWNLTDKELEKEAGRFQIGGYANANGVIDRGIIIEQLSKKDSAKHAGVSAWATIINLIIAVVSIAINSYIATGGF